MTDTAHSPSGSTKLTVYYDGACPLCRREISVYRKANGADRIDWVDVSATQGPDVEDDLSKSDALSRFHVRRQDGQLASGAEAFADLWMTLPSLSWAGRLLALPGIRHVAEVFYRVFLRFRPLLHRMISR